MIFVNFKIVTLNETMKQGPIVRNDVMYEALGC